MSNRTSDKNIAKGSRKISIISKEKISNGVGSIPSFNETEKTFKRVIEYHCGKIIGWSI